jgi:hypothetical protein
MFELLFVMALIGAVILLPLVVIGLVLRLLFDIVILPFQILGAVIGLSVTGLVLGAIALVLAGVLGLITLVGVAVAGLPLLVFGLLIWGLVRLLRREKRTPHAA